MKGPPSGRAAMITTRSLSAQGMRTATSGDRMRRITARSASTPALAPGGTGQGDAGGSRVTSPGVEGDDRAGVQDGQLHHVGAVRGLAAGRHAEVGGLDGQV